MNTHIRKIKFIFLIAGIFLMALMIVAIYSLERIAVDIMKTLKIEFNYARYKTSYVFNNENNFLASAVSVIFSKKPGVVLGSDGPPTVGVPVLVYHGITAVGDRFNLTPYTFWDKMLALKKAGYHTITLEDFYLFQIGAKELDDKAFLLTFDDGRSDSYLKGDPVLRALGFNAVMFVATSHLIADNPIGYYLNQHDVKEMLQSGRWEIGSHAVQDGRSGFVSINQNGIEGNFLSNKKWLEDKNRLETDEEYDARIVKELSESKEFIEKTFGIGVIAFSYPFGDYGQQSQNNEERAEKVIAETIKPYYSLAFKQVWPEDSEYSLNYREPNPYHLKRIEPNTSWTGEELVKALEMARAKPLPYNEDFSKSSWKRNWGLVEVNSVGLRVRSSAFTTGGFGFLDGTRDWDDYFYTASMRWEKGSHASLIARFQDGDNYASCTFRDGGVRIEERIKGENITLEDESDQFPISREEIILGMLVEGRTVRCFKDQREVALSDALDSQLYYGGIGVRIWDEELGRASLIINSLEVVPAHSAKVRKL